MDDKIVEQLVQSTIQQYAKRNVQLPKEYVELLRQHIQGYFGGLSERDRQRAIDNILSGF